MAQKASLRMCGISWYLQEYNGYEFNPWVMLDTKLTFDIIQETEVRVLLNMQPVYNHYVWFHKSDVILKNNRDMTLIECEF